MKKLRALFLLAAVALAGVPACKPAEAATIIKSSPVAARTVLLTSFLSQEVTLTATGTYVIPGTTLPGYTFSPTGAHFICSEATGAISAAPVTKAGNDGSHVNILASGSLPTTAQFALGKNSINNMTLATKPVVTVDLATPITFEVGTAATTGSSITFKGYIRIFGFLTGTIP